MPMIEQQWIDYCMYILTSLCFCMDVCKQKEKREKREKIKAKVTQRSWARVEKKEEEKPDGVSVVINSNCEAREPPLLLSIWATVTQTKKKLDKKECVSWHVCVCVCVSTLRCVCFWEKSCSSLIQSRDLWSGRLVFHAVSLCIYRPKGGGGSGSQHPFSTLTDPIKYLYSHSAGAAEIQLD